MSTKLQDGGESFLFSEMRHLPFSLGLRPVVPKEGCHDWGRTRSQRHPPVRVARTGIRTRSLQPVEGNEATPPKEVRIPFRPDPNPTQDLEVPSTSQCVRNHTNHELQETSILTDSKHEGNSLRP